MTDAVPDSRRESLQIAEMFGIRCCFYPLFKEYSRVHKVAKLLPPGPHSVTGREEKMTQLWVGHSTFLNTHPEQKSQDKCLRNLKEIENVALFIKKLKIEVERWQKWRLKRQYTRLGRDDWCVHISLHNLRTDSFLKSAHFCKTNFKNTLLGTSWWSSG